MIYWNIFIPILIIIHISKGTLAIGVYFTRSPESLVVPIHDEVVFDCTLNIGVDKIKWRHNSEDFLHPAAAHTNTNSRLVVKVESVANIGDYQCVATIGASSLASTAATLSLATLKEFDNQTLLNDNKFIITAGNTIALNCGKPIQSDPPALIQYYKNGQALLPWTTPVSSAGSVLLKNIQSDHAGHYTCSATNNIVSRVVISPMSIYLDVSSNHSASPPRFIGKPPSLYVAQKNSNVSIECAPYGEPIPIVQWLGIHKNLLFNDNKTNIEPGLLTIRNLSIEDSGVYECIAKNNHGEISHLITLQVQVLPYVKSGPNEFVAINESSSETLKCEAIGTPTPEIKWYLNGKPINDSNIIAKEGILIFNNTQKYHAGFVQCFACNILGCSYWAATIQVNPKQITQLTSQQHYYEDSTTRSPPRDRKDRNHKGKGRKKDKKKKGNEKMIPPSQPNITRLTENSVMVRWYVPPNDGLPIRFFKLQYKEVSGSWNTSSDDIQMHIRCYQVDKLIPDHAYVFKVAAVYSNDDNTCGPPSNNFFLNKGPPNRSLIPPTLVSAKATNTTSILLEWEYLNSVLAPVQGFYVYYRATSTAGDYIKAIVDGQDTRRFVVTHLSPDTSYDLKLQSFTVNEASNFSTILTHKTFGEPKTSTDTPKWTDNTSDSGTNNSLYSTIGGVRSLYVLLGVVTAVIGAIVLLIFFTVCIYNKRSSNSNSPELNKSSEAVSGLEPLSMNGFSLKNGKMVNGCTLPMASDNTHGHTHTPNGYVIHPINITSNPLAPDAKNTIEISYLTNHNNNRSESEMNSLPRRAMPKPTESQRTWCAKDENYV